VTSPEPLREQLTQQIAERDQYIQAWQEQARYKALVIARLQDRIHALPVVSVEEPKPVQPWRRKLWPCETEPISLQQFERDWYRVLANFGGPPKQQAPSALEPNPNPFNDEKEHLSGRCSDLPLTGERHHPFRPPLNKRFTVKRRVDEHH
jgi:hypothetical protein